MSWMLRDFSSGGATLQTTLICTSNGLWSSSDNKTSWFQIGRDYTMWHWCRVYSKLSYFLTTKCCWSQSHYFFVHPLPSQRHTISGSCLRVIKFIVNHTNLSPYLRYFHTSLPFILFVIVFSTNLTPKFLTPFTSSSSTATQCNLNAHLSILDTPIMGLHASPQPGLRSRRILDQLWLLTPVSKSEIGRLRLPTPESEFKISRLRLLTPE